MTDFNPYQYPQPAVPSLQAPIEKPTSVTVFGVLNCVLGGIGIVCTPFSMLGLFMVDLFPMHGNQIEMAAGYKTFLLISSFLGIGIAAWLLSLGVGLLKFKSWARRGSVIYAVIIIIWGIIGAGINVAAYSLGWITAPGEGTPGYIGGIVGGMCGGLIGLIYPVLLLIFMLSPKVKQVFAAIGG